MAVSKVATASGTADPAHTPSAGSDRMVYIGMCTANSVGGLYNATALTYGGQTCTAIDNAQESRQGCGISVWRLDEAGIAAMSGTAITPTWGDTDGTPDAPMYCVTEFAGVDQTTPNTTPVKGTNDITQAAYDPGDLTGVVDGYGVAFSVFGQGGATHTFDALDDDELVLNGAGESARQGSLISTSTGAIDLAVTYTTASRPGVVIGLMMNPAAGNITIPVPLGPLR